MKTFYHKEKTGHTRLNLSELLHSLMTPESSYGSFENVKLEGRNFGATMIARRAADESHDCCSVNIYVSNNIQGVNNSILVGSAVKMGDPGVGLSLKDLKLDRGFQTSSKKKISSSLVGFCLISFAIVALSVLLSVT